MAPQDPSPPHRNGRSRRPFGLLLLCVPLVGVLLLGACASSKGGSGDPTRVLYRSYGQGLRLELVSKTHTDAVSYYSEERNDASRKVQSSEVMDALSADVMEAGFDNFASDGTAPNSGGQHFTQSLEVWRDGKARSWAVGSGSQLDERVAFSTCVKDFLAIYNNTVGLQAVHNDEGAAYFDRYQSIVPGQSR